MVFFLKTEINLLFFAVFGGILKSVRAVEKGLVVEVQESELNNQTLLHGPFIPTS
jgi:hypothetical protein